jgi:hypothetical protein
MSNHEDDPLVDAMRMSRAMQMLVGCGWGRGVTSTEDKELCAAQAVQIIILHEEGGGEAEVRLCAKHRDYVLSQTDPHEEEA